MSERFWPVAEAAQADYEALRAAALAGEPARDELAAARFARRGLAGLIAWPSSEPIYLGAVVGARSAGVVGRRGPARGGARRGLRLPRRARTGERRAATGGRAMRVALYARVSTERQQERGTVASQLELLRAAARADDHEVVAEFVDDGYSGARLDRPALDRLRDAAEAGALDAVLCLCPDRLARAYAYQVLILDELERFGVPVHFLDGPAPGDDPQAKLLVQVQGVIAEYERAKIAERYRRGKLHRARAGEVFFWKVPYGYRRDRRRARTARAHGDLRARGRDRARDLRRPRRRTATRSARSRTTCTTAAFRRRPASRSGAPRPCSACCTTRPTSAASTTTAARRSTAPPPAAARAAPRRATANARASNGSRSRCPAIIDADTFERAQHVRRENPKWSPRGDRARRTGCCAA